MNEKKNRNKTLANKVHNNYIFVGCFLCVDAVINSARCQHIFYSYQLCRWVVVFFTLYIAHCVFIMSGWLFVLVNWKVQAAIKKVAQLQLTTGRRSPVPIKLHLYGNCIMWRGHFHFFFTGLSILHVVKYFGFIDKLKNH